MRPILARFASQVMPIFLVLLAAVPIQAGDQIAAEVLKKTKKATVYLRVTLAGDRVVEGSGFFGGAKNIVITNAHVLGMLSPDGRPPQKIEVVTDSGEPGEKKYLGRLLQVDPTADLAAVLVQGADLPEPLFLGLGKDLIETQSLFVFGFPFGKQLGKNITVSRTAVSSLRKNPNGSLRDIQVNGGMNPGNSGGPVIDAKGQAVGVSVAIVAGTQINFAIPGETVRTFLGGRYFGRVFLAPYQEGDVRKLPVVYNMIDPLLQIQKVYVDVWTGKPGPDRKPVLKIGVEPQPEDSEKTNFELVYKGRSATGDIILPAMPKGKVMWIQLSYARGDGKKIWNTAGSYANQLAPVERKPVTLAYEHRPDNPCKVTLTATTDLKLRALDGTDKHLVTEIKAELIERLAGKITDGAAPVLLKFTSLTVKQTLEKEEITDKDLLNSLKFAKAILALSRVDKQGDLSIQKLAIGVKNRGVQEDLAIYGVQVLQYLEAVTVPLPGMEVSHEKPWKNKREMALGSGRSAQPASVDVIYTLHGMRDTDKRHEAVVFLKGDIKGQKGNGLAASGRMTGQAVVDLKTNQVRFADANLNMDLDLSNGRGASFQANGTLKIVLTRKPLEGQELADVLKEKSGPVSPPKEKTPAGPTGAKVLPGDLFGFLKQSVKDNKLTSVDVKGFTASKKMYRDANEDGGVLIGLQVGLGKFGKNSTINALRPIYLTKDGEKMGEWIGKAPANPVAVKAKDGYVVSAVNLRAGLGLDGLSLTFTKLGKDRLQIDDTYDSDWTGGMGGNPSRIGGQGSVFAGIVGHLNNAGAPCSLGLLAPVLPGE